MHDRLLPFTDLPHDDPSANALAGLDLGERFRFWRGKSGRRYVFSVFGLSDHPAFEHAVAIAVHHKPQHRRRAVWIGIMAGADWPALATAAAYAGCDEVHLHLLAADDSRRAGVVQDLDPHGRRRKLPGVR